MFMFKTKLTKTTQKMSLRGPKNSMSVFFTYLLLSRELRTIKLSSRNVIISDVSPPFSRSSPLALKLEKLRILPVQSLTTWVNLASMSFSFTAEIHTSWYQNIIFMLSMVRMVINCRIAKCLTSIHSERLTGYSYQNKEIFYRFLSFLIIVVKCK